VRVDDELGGYPPAALAEIRRALSRSQLRELRLFGDGNIHENLGDVRLLRTWRVLSRRGLIELFHSVDHAWLYLARLSQRGSAFLAWDHRYGGRGGAKGGGQVIALARQRRP
jgi:hypothetical protein